MASKGQAEDKTCVANEKAPETAQVKAAAAVQTTKEKAAEVGKATCDMLQKTGEQVSSMAQGAKGTILGMGKKDDPNKTTTTPK